MITPLSDLPALVGVEVMDEARDKLQRDARLMTRVAEGDALAKRALVEMLWPRVHGIALHMSPYRQEVDDLSQEALFQVLRAAPRFRADGCVEAWADVVAVRTILKRLRRIHAERRVVCPGAVVDVLPATGDDDAYLRRERSRCVDSLLHRLPPQQRMALVLKLVRGHTVAEVASLMERSESSVRYQLKTARVSLRRLALADKRARDLFSLRRA